MNISASDRYRFIVEVLALLDETGEVDLVSFAAERGMTLDGLKEILDPLLYLEFRDAQGNLVDGSRYFYVSTDDHLAATEQLWIATARTMRVTPADALRLLVTGMVAEAAGPVHAGLAEALKKLKEIVNAELQIELKLPPEVARCRDALDRKRTIKFSYFGELSAKRSDYEIEPCFVGSRWGNWYLIGFPVGTKERRTFRIDRMITASVTGTTCVPDPSITIPDDGWDLDEYKHTVRLQLPMSAIERILQPVEVSVVSTDGDQSVIDVTVISKHRLIDTLVVLGAEAEIIDDPVREKLRSQQATEILKLYR